MKLLKKLLTGAAVAVAALSMMSCGGLSGLMQRTFGERDIFYYNDATYDSGAYGKWDVKEVLNDKTNGEWIRCVKMLFYKQHTDLTGKIDLDVRTIDNDGDGVLGVVFDITKGRNSAGETTWNFGVVGIAYDSSNKKAKYYVSHFYNITDADMDKKNFNCYDASTGKDITKTEYDPDCDTPYEIPFKYKNSNNVESTWRTLDGVYTVVGDGNGIPKGRISVVVQVKEDSNGNYNVNFYSVDGYKGNANTDAEAIAGCTKLDPSTSMPASAIGKTGPRQAYVGVYGNIYNGKTLNGSMEIAGLTNDAIVAY